MYLYVKDPFESNYELLIDGRGKLKTENLKKSESTHQLFTNN